MQGEGFLGKNLFQFLVKLFAPEGGKRFFEPTNG